MDKVARLAANDRRALFAEGAAQLGLAPTVVEKDFWVCFVLRLLFERSRFKDHLVFKGGTSLSKAFGLIDRFSEDVDLVLDTRVIGMEGGLEGGPLSKTRQDKLNKDLNRRAAFFIDTQLIPELQTLVERVGLSLQVAIDASDPQTVNVRYPAAFSETYIRPEVRLEIGPLASWVPSAVHTIQPYAAPLFPALFEKPACSVVTIMAERTFWEKATILHQEAHREGLIPKRYSRHYYDLHKLAASPVKASAFARAELLQDVVAFKARFYPSRWARFDLAIPGSFKLLPADPAKIGHLAQDYRDMRLMLFGTPPAFEDILTTLRELERAINESAPLSALAVG